MMNILLTYYVIAIVFHLYLIVKINESGYYKSEDLHVWISGNIFLFTIVSATHLIYLIWN